MNNARSESLRSYKYILCPDCCGNVISPTSIPTFKTLLWYVAFIRYRLLTIQLLWLSSRQTFPEFHNFILHTIKNIKHFTQKTFHSSTTHARCNIITKLTQAHNAFQLQGMNGNCKVTIGDRFQREAYTVRNVVEGSILFQWTCGDQHHGKTRVVLSDSAD